MAVSSTCDLANSDQNTRTARFTPDIDVKYGNSVLRDDIFGDLWNLPLLRERVMAYEQAHLG